MILFFDFETTGLADFNKSASDPEQPHIFQMACKQLFFWLKGGAL